MNSRRVPAKDVTVRPSRATPNGVLALAGGAGRGSRTGRFVLPVVTAFFVAACAPAQAAEGGGGGPSEVLFVTQIVLLILLGGLLGEAMQRIGQPAVMGQLLAGILLGPSVLGTIW